MLLLTIVGTGKTFKLSLDFGLLNKKKIVLQSDICNVKYLSNKIFELNIEVFLNEFLIF